MPTFATAQATTRVVPPGFAEIEGNLLSTSLFGRAQSGMQFLCDPLVVASAPGLVLDVSFRVESDGNTYAAYTKQYKLTVAQTSVTAATMTRDPVANHAGATPTVVFQMPLNVPASSPVTVLPKPFSITLPFSAPFAYDPALGGLLLTRDDRRCDHAAGHLPPRCREHAQRPRRRHRRLADAGLQRRWRGDDAGRRCDAAPLRRRTRGDAHEQLPRQLPARGIPARVHAAERGPQRARHDGLHAEHGHRGKPLGPRDPPAAIHRSTSASRTRRRSKGPRSSRRCWESPRPRARSPVP
jgi:hypothetical protein